MSVAFQLTAILLLVIIVVVAGWYTYRDIKELTDGTGLGAVFPWHVMLLVMGLLALFHMVNNLGVGHWDLTNMVCYHVTNGEGALR
jgi:hypothetical protein